MLKCILRAGEDVQRDSAAYVILSNWRIDSVTSISNIIGTRQSYYLNNEPKSTEYKQIIQTAFLFF